MNVEIKNQSINITFKGSSFLISGASSVNWGSIGGTLSAQTDLQNILNTKFDNGDVLQTSSGAGSAVQSGFVGIDGEFNVGRFVNAKGNTPTQYVNAGNGPLEYYINGTKEFEINTSNISAENNQIKNVGTPTVGNDATNKSYVDNAVANTKYYNLSSTAITAPIDTNLNTLYSYTIPAGTLGPNSVLSLEMLWSATNNANAKTISCTIGGSNIFSINFSNNSSLNRSLKLYNRNATNNQVAFIAGNSIGFGSATTAAATYSIDFSINQTVSFTIQKATAGDMVRLEAVLTQIINQ